MLNLLVNMKNTVVFIFVLIECGIISSPPYLLAALYYVFFYFFRNNCLICGNFLPQKEN